jgi:F0F1-type ATP synthase assembly protein I
MAWSSRITAVALEMVLPGVFGYWVDQQLGTRALFLVLGMVFGVITGMLSLIRLTKPPQDGEPLEGTRSHNRNSQRR